MEWLLIGGGIWLVFWVIGKVSGSSASNSLQSRSGSTTRNRSRATSGRSSRTPSDPKVYRPKARSRSGTSIKFRESSDLDSGNTAPSEDQLDGLHDAFTGAPLDTGLGLYRCSDCQVYYHKESYQVLSEANNGQCVACSSVDIVSLTSAKARKTRGRDHDPNVINLQNFKQHVGSVVTFEGEIHKVLTSQRGKDYAAMFENKGWTKGLKLVFFGGSIRKAGGKRYITGLEGKTVKVRGLLINHDVFGHEIIVSEKSMILSAKK
jgi:hypothetical protein